MLCHSCNTTKVLNDRFSALIHEMIRAWTFGRTTSENLSTFNTVENFSLRNFHMKIEHDRHGFLAFNHRLIKRVSRDLF